MRRRNLFIAWLIVTTLGVGFAQRGDLKHPDKNVMAMENVKQLLLVMDTGKSGKISKQQFMAFMEAEFDKIDVEKKGELDQAAIRESTEYVRQARSADLGR
jgi:hypothetical protein